MKALLRSSQSHRSRALVRGRFSLHETAVKGFGAHNADIYSKSRPSYSSETIKQCCDIIGAYTKVNNKMDALNLVELGAGTGKFTESFFNYEKVLNRGKKNTYVACDQSQSFLEKIDIKNTQNPLDIDIIVASSNNLPLKNNSADCILIAQAFHWMASLDSVMEMSRVLKQDAPLVLIWNAFDESFDWILQIENILTTYYNRESKRIGQFIPRYRDQVWQNIFSNEAVVKQFKLPLRKCTSHQVVQSSRQDILNRLVSTSVISVLPEKERHIFFSKINEILDNHEQTRGKKTYDLRYTTDVYYVNKV